MSKLDELKTLMEAALRAEQDYPIHMKMHQDSAEYVFAAARLKTTRDALNAKVTPAMTLKLIEMIEAQRRGLSIILLRSNGIIRDLAEEYLKTVEEIERSL